MNEKPGVGRGVLTWIGVFILIDVFVVAAIVRACVR